MLHVITYSNMQVVMPCTNNSCLHVQVLMACVTIGTSIYCSSGSTYNLYLESVNF